MRLKMRIRRQAKLITRRAKILPKIAYSKGKANVQAYLRDVKAQREEMRAVEREAKQEEARAYREAYKIELMERAKERGQLKARAKAKSSSGGGLLGQLGQIGRNLDGYDPVGMGNFGAGLASSSTSSVVFSGMSQGKRKRRRR